jgi:hypothetical protein
MLLEAFQVWVLMMAPVCFLGSEKLFIAVMHRELKMLIVSNSYCPATVLRPIMQLSYRVTKETAIAHFASSALNGILNIHHHGM